MSTQRCTHGGAPCPRIVEQLRHPVTYPAVPEGMVRVYETGELLPDTRDAEGHPFRFTELTREQAVEQLGIDPDDELELQYRWGYR